MKFPHIYQSPKSASCGPYSLFMINEYYKGIPYTPRQLVSLCKTTARWGTEDEDLVEAAQRLGYDVIDFTELFKSSVSGGYQFHNATYLICFMDTEKTGHWAVCTSGTRHGNGILATLQDPYYGPDSRLHIQNKNILGMYRLTPMK